MSNQDFEGFGPQPQSFEAPPQHPGTARTSGTAIASLVLGLIGCCGFTAILGVILGFTSLGVIRRSNGFVVGRGLAMAGIILGVVWIGLWAAFWRWPYAGYNFAASTRTAAERSDEFLDHLGRGEFEQGLALTSEGFRESNNAESLKALYEATAAMHGALLEWTLVKVDNEQKPQGNVGLLIHCDFDLKWKEGETRGRVTFFMALEDLLQGPVDPFIRDFELE